MADYCVFCGAAMNQSWVCDACGATTANPWPSPSHRRQSEASELEAAHDQLRPVTALFGDVVGSTTLGEQLAPAEIKALIGECVTRMVRAVESYGGVVGSFMGDGIAAFFGLDAAKEDDAIRAGLAGLRILEAISDYAGEIEAAWEIPSVAVRVGINSGRVATGLVGSAAPQYVALGDAINIAARLQARADPGTAIVGGSTAGQLAARFEIERLGQVEIRGRSAPVEAWKLLRYIGPPRPARLSGFVGRQTELSRLDRAIEALSLGRGGIAVVRGEPGIGKSRTIRECRVRTQAGVQWLSGRCASQQVLRPYGPFVEMLCDWLNIEVQTPEIVSRVRLLARLKDTLGDDAPTVFPFLTQLLAVGETEEYVRVATPSNEQGGAAVRQAYASWISALSDERPIILAIDDLDRADGSTRLLLDDLFRMTESIPLLLVLAMRDEPGNPGWEARLNALANHPRRIFELLLEPLAESEAEEFIALQDGNEVLTPALRCALRTRAEGNPLYLEELTRTAMEAIERTAPDVAIDVEAELELPAALEGLLLARIDRVPARARLTLEVGAIYGRRFPKSILDVVTNPIDLNENLEQLIREGIIQEDGLSPSRYFTFRHGLYQEAVLTTLTTERRSQLHEAVAVALEASTAEPMPEEVASHYLASGNQVKAIEYLERAGRRAALLHSLSEAADLVDQARKLSSVGSDRETRRRLTALAAELSRQMGRYDDASELWHEVLRTAPDESTRASVFLELARTEFELGSPESADAACDRALALDGSPGTRCDSLLLKAAIAVGQDKLEVAQKLLTEVDRLPDALPLRADIQRRSLWAGYHAGSGNLAEAERYSTETLALAEGCGDFALELRAKRDFGIVQFVQGRLTVAESSLRSVYLSAMDTGHVLRAQEAVANLMVVYLCLGDLRAGADLGEDALGWIKTPIWRAVVLTNLGAIQREMQSGDPRACYMECMHLLEGEGDVPIAAIAALRLAVIRLEEGESADAEETALKIARTFDASGRHDVLVQALRTLAIVELTTNRPEMAIRHARRAHELLGQSDRTDMPSVLRVVGQSEFSVGEWEVGMGHLLESLEVARSMSMRLEEAETLVALGTADREQSRRHFNRAREIFAACGSEHGLSQLRDAVALASA